MDKKQHHVVYNRTGWAVKSTGSSEFKVTTTTKTDAIRIGRVISQRQGSDLVIHDKEGKVRK